MLVLRPGALGDTLLAVPALRALRRRFAPVKLAAHGGAARLLASVGEVDAGIAFDDVSIGRLLGGKASDEAIVAWLNAAEMPALRDQALVIARSKPSGSKVHCAQYLLETLAPLGVDTRLDDQPLAIAPIPTAEVLVHPGSGSPRKNWPPARFAEVIRALDAAVRLIVGEADSAVAAELETCLGRRLPRLEHPPLEELAARLAGCRAYLGNDSGVSHLAGLCGARTVVLFGPTSPTVWRPLGPDVHVEPFDANPLRITQFLALPATDGP